MLTSPRLALLLLALIAAYTGIVPWLKLGTVPGAESTWIRAVGLDHPFSAAPFILLILLLFICTAACTSRRCKNGWRLFSGDVKAQGERLEIATLIPGWGSILQAEGYGRSPTGFFRNRLALLGGAVLHVGIVIVLAGVAVQQGFQDSGSFELAEGEMIRLDEATVLFDTRRGLLAPRKPPAVDIALDSFDPYFRQTGFAPDRLSRLLVRNHADGTEKLVSLDRSHGLRVGGAEIYHAIPTGLALQIEIGGINRQAFHLRQVSPRMAAGEFTAPGGQQVRFVLQSERPLDDPMGSGTLQIRIDAPYQTTLLEKGVPFLFGSEPARITGLLRWAGYTYSRSPGVEAVFFGFGVVLLGCLLLVFPAGAVTISETVSGSELYVYQNRGQKQLAAELTGKPGSGSESEG